MTLTSYSLFYLWPQLYTLLGSAFAFKLTGPILGALILIFQVSITDYSQYLLIKGGLLCDAMSYQGLVLAAFGRPGYYFLSFLQFIYPFLAMVSYNIVVGDTITFVVRRLLHLQNVESIFLSRHFVTFMTSLLVTLPLSLYR